MRKRTVSYSGVIKRNETYEGKSIEMMIAERMEGEKIELGGKALLYTERKDGVVPETNIRSDRFDLAMMAHDTVERARVSKRDAIGKKPETEKGSEAAKSTQGTDA